MRRKEILRKKSKQLCNLRYLQYQQRQNSKKNYFDPAQTEWTKGAL